MDYNILQMDPEEYPNIETVLSDGWDFDPGDVLVFPNGDSYMYKEHGNWRTLYNFDANNEPPDCATLYCKQMPDYRGDLLQTLDSLVEEYSHARESYFAREAGLIPGDHQDMDLESARRRTMRAVIRLHNAFQYKDNRPPYPLDIERV